MTTFIGAMAAMNQHTESAAIALCCIGSAFVGYIELVALTTAPLCLDEADIGLATGVLAAVRTGLAGVALSIYSSVLATKVPENLNTIVGPAAVNAGLEPSSIPALFAGFGAGWDFSEVPGINPVIIEVAIDAYKTAYSQAFSLIYLISITFGGLAVIACCLSPNLEHQFNDSVARRMPGKHISDSPATSKTTEV